MEPANKDARLALGREVSFRGEVRGRSLKRSVLERTLERRVWGGVWRRGLKEEFGKEYRRGV